MIRCRQCNSELTEQARFCNVCGLPQEHQEPALEKPTHNGAISLDTNNSNQCTNCGAETPSEARFCAVCGSTQSFKNVVDREQLPRVPAASVSKENGQDDLTARLQPSVAIKPAQQSKTSQGQLSKEADNAVVRPKTNTHAPAFPSRPKSNDVKALAAIKEPDISEPVPETPIASTKSSQPNQEIAAQSVKSPNNGAASAKLQSDSANNNADDSRTPGLIRPITPKSSSRSVIPSRPDVIGQAVSNPQPTQSTQTPESPISTPQATSSSYVNQQSQKPSSSALMEPRTESRDKQQVLQRTTQAAQNYSLGTIGPNSVQNRPQQIAPHRVPSDKPMLQAPSSSTSDATPSTNTSVENGRGMNGTSDAPTIDLLNPASFMATSKAAEQWRKSWRDRQYAEAGPAETVSRGQASVPTPLTSMQQSFLRMRAIQKSNKQQGKRTVNFGTWMIIFLMMCLIIGLGASIIFSYFPSSPFATQTSSSSNKAAQPTLTLVGTATQTVTIGRSIQLRGGQFGGSRTITFLRDTATPITDSSGKNISIRTDSQGAFLVTIPIDNSWAVGSHSIEALDQSSNQNAFLTLEVIPQGTATTSSTDLSITMQGKPVSQLSFTSVMGQKNPDPQRITITNTSGSPLQWTALASTNNNLNWLQINDNNNYGQLAISQPHDILISVNMTGLHTTDKHHPYRGQIIFTMNNRQLLTFPVQLQIVDATPEMVLSPNPIVAPIGPGNTCKTGVTLTLINLGSASISWAVNPDKANIQFINNGQPLKSGTLLPAGSQLPSGQPGDTTVLALQCNNVQIGQTYTVRVFANQLQWTESVIITNG